MEQDELLMKEYETIAKLIVHWDKFFYETSRFYLLIQSGLLAVVISGLKDQLADEDLMKPNIVFLFVFLILFSLIVCYIWFRANRSCREYLKVCFKRALQIESNQALKGIVKLATHFEQDRFHVGKGNIKHSSDWWEIHIPLVFMMAWLVCLILVARDYNNSPGVILAGVIIIVILIFLDITGFPNRKRI